MHPTDTDVKMAPSNRRYLTYVCTGCKESYPCNTLGKRICHECKLKKQREKHHAIMTSRKDKYRSIAHVRAKNKLAEK